MTIWIPNLNRFPGPRYLAIANAIEADITAGNLAAGGRLPTHRDLAYRVGVTVGTVTRAYAEARRRGLLSGEVGRGTFVHGPDRSSSEFRLSDRDPSGNEIDLRFGIPYVADSGPFLQATLAEIARAPDSYRLLDYNSGGGLPDHRAAIADWTRRAGENAQADRVVICGGTQHAVSVVLMAMTKPGDVVLTESMTFPPFKVLAGNLGLRLEGVPMDEQGLDPQALDHLCRTAHPTMLYCMPTYQNPTTAVMGEERRRTIVAVARRHNLPIIEDDIYATLQEKPPTPLAAIAPDLVHFIDSTSKGMAPGLRIGFILTDPGNIDAMHQALNATTWMASPITAEIAARWMRDGTAERLTARQREESAARLSIMREVLGSAILPTTGLGCHTWLTLPESWKAPEFVAESARRGVRVLPAETFAVGRHPVPNAVRIGVGAAHSRDDLRRAAEILRTVMDDSDANTTPAFM
jgi:DNA-binding transcriptional MocR family regulator